ncbi:MAG: PAS domain S-box protein [Bryobacteraceae bacterium]|nr:PAS domain S-box protein [Bryobacterales bacterium]MEB2360890.1 PAS domain S-box protein [Bryobacterales bacterium]NUN00848.1 PAS domain S-box protein [Bryobacteraceae bacterium]
MHPPVPSEEERRLAAVERYHILDTPPEVALNRITALAAHLFDVPFSSVTFVDRTRQWFKAVHGLEVREAPRDTALCSYALLSSEVLAVLDTARDPRFRSNPLVIGPPYLRFYAGAPLTTPDGFRLGTLNVMDTLPHEDFSDRERGLLEDLAATVMDEIELRLAAHHAGDLSSGLIDASPLAIISTGRDGRILSWSAAAKQMFGWTAAEVIGLPPPIIPDGAADEFDGYRVSVLRGDILRNIETICRRKDGTMISVSLSVAPLYDPSGEITGYMAIIDDITERRLRDQQSARTQKIEAVGQLAGGIAHDFNNLLTVISGYSSLLLQSLAETDPVAAQVREIALAADRAAVLTRQLLAFSRKQVLHPLNVDVNAVVLESERMARHFIGENIELCLVLAAEPLRAVVDAGQLVQVLINLALNSRDAMPDGGVLTFQTAAVEIGPEFVQAHPAVTPGAYVMLAVSDTGVGMDQATMSRIFEPFFTTKGPGAGTGLGLATVYGIVKQSSGHIFVYSEPGRGTTFRIYIPRIFDSVSTTPSAGSKVSPSSTAATILLVEDESSLRKLTRDILRRSGFKVIEAANGCEALLACEQSTDEISLMIADLVMPGMTGLELAKRLASLRPAMKVLFMSGYSSHAALASDPLEGSLPFLQKPFTPGTLTEKVREILNHG